MRQKLSVAHSSDKEREQDGKGAICVVKVTIGTKDNKFQVANEEP